MKLSARARYATRILLELTENTDTRPISAFTLSQLTGVSVQFVEQILKPLKQKGITTSIRGASGGHRLARPAEAISLADVVRAMEGSIKLANCCDEDFTGCARLQTCLTRKAWVHVSKSLERELDTISLANLTEHNYLLTDTPPTKQKTKKTVTTKLTPSADYKQKSVGTKIPTSSHEVVRPTIRRVKILRPASK